MRRTILTDTTPLYAAASARDQYHARAQAELSELERGGWTVAVTVPTMMARVQSYHDQPLTLFDALLAAVSSRLALPVWTYDAHFDVLRVARWYPDTARREP